ncbi:unnamed protein product [Owenia fusiformis]|uniref:Uncharacterized protein n=1 Tax=Owenia fusiformis TaxID=6347 RepID=A0A8J1Y051_OWEFU|nr:unnamed protein product [Owenia fusiformis]
MSNGMQEYSRRRHDSETTSASQKTDTTWRYSVFGPERLGKGAMLFTGPDGIRDHRVTAQPESEHRWVGEDTMSAEGTSEVSYLWRSPRGFFPLRPKSACVGEVGWCHPRLTERPPLASQIQLGEFRQAVEDRATHTDQSPWYRPTPSNSYEAIRSARLSASYPFPAGQGRQQNNTNYNNRNNNTNRYRSSYYNPEESSYEETTDLEGGPYRPVSRGNSRMSNVSAHSRPRGQITAIVPTEDTIEEE